MSDDPLLKERADYSDLIEKISVPDSPVGIDAGYTHAIIIQYLKNISDRLDRLEKAVAEKQ